MTVVDKGHSLRVLHVTSGGLGEGAARGAYWLHKALLAQGLGSRLLLCEADGQDPTVQALAPTPLAKLGWKLRIRLESAPCSLYRSRTETLSTGLSGFSITRHEWYQWADIIHLHWINHATVSLAAMLRMTKPLVWTMRDMWPMTGGCHQFGTCTRYEIGCGACPKLGTTGPDLSSWIVRRKQRLVPAHTRFVAVSTWQANCACHSAALQGRPIDVIPNCIDTDAFFPVPKAAARAALGLPEKGNVVLAGGLYNDAILKGANELREALSIIRPSVQVVMFGRPGAFAESEGIRHLGLLHDDISLRLAYSAADVYVAPTLQDAFCKTLAESMACGTPVVAFDATGPRDIVEHKVNGYKARPFDAGDLAAGVRFVLEDAERWTRLSQAAREKVRESFSPEVVALRYLDLYRQAAE